MVNDIDSSQRLRHRRRSDDVDASWRHGRCQGQQVMSRIGRPHPHDDEDVALGGHTVGHARGLAGVLPATVSGAASVTPAGPQLTWTVAPTPLENSSVAMHMSSTPGWMKEKPWQFTRTGTSSRTYMRMEMSWGAKFQKALISRRTRPRLMRSDRMY